MSENRKHLKTYGAVYFFIFAAVAALFPLYPLILQSKGFTPSQIGFIMGGYDLFSIFGLLILGYAYDRIGSPRATIIALLLVSVVLLFFMAREAAPVPLISLSLILGFFVKSPTSLIDAHYGQQMADLTDSYGKTRLGGSAGFMIMALLIQITGIVRGSAPITVFYGFAVPVLITALIILALPSGPAGRRTGFKKQMKEKQGFSASIKSFPALFWIGLIIAFLNALALSGHYTFFSLLLKNKFGLEKVSGFWAIGPIFEIPLFLLSPILLKKMKLKHLWTFSMAAGFARMQVYSLSSSLLPLYLIQATHSLSFGINHLCMINLINRKTTPESRGLAMSIFTAIGMGLSLFTGGVIGGFILKSGDFPLLFQIFSLFPLMAIAVAFLFLKDGTYESSQTAASDLSEK